MFDFQIFGAGLGVPEATLFLSGEDGRARQICLTTTNCKKGKIFLVYSRAVISFLLLLLLSRFSRVQLCATP